MRTIEQKISDAGPNPQRVNPHILTGVRNMLLKEGHLIRKIEGNTHWYHRADTPNQIVRDRLAEQLEVFLDFSARSLTLRVGQTLEIATFRALMRIPQADFFGRFLDLHMHDDATLYKKEEPPNYIGPRSLPGTSLDFIMRSPSAGYLGIECKNVREWLYPDRKEIKETLSKCLALDCIPVLIGRRIPYITFFLLNKCGVIVHQTYNQLLPTSAQDVADKAKHKLLLGYHDIRTGNMPDTRLLTFITKNLLLVAPDARLKYEDYRDLLEGFANQTMPYKEFAARVLRRDRGENEDLDFPNGDPADW